MKTIYFDNAATTFRKPQKVYDKTDKAFRNFAANSGRGAYPLSLEASEKIFECRAALANAFGASPENVIFTFNTTYALNMAIKGIARHGDHFLISNLEHNSVLRPVHKLKAQGKIDYDVFDTYFYGNATPEKVIKELKSKIRPNTRCIVCTHTSNICSYTPPIYEIGKFCREHNIIFIVDAAQGAGHKKIDMVENNIDILCIPSHKGLYGPQGVGAMLLGEGISPDTLLEGGSGINSLIAEMPGDPPERYEAGTLPCQSIYGMLCGLNFVEQYGYDNVRKKEEFLWERLFDHLNSCDKIKIYDRDHSGSIFLFNVPGVPSNRVGEMLADRGICVRAGYHCAALAHDALMTHLDNCGGAVRVSFSVFNTADEVDVLAKEILNIAK